MDIMKKRILAWFLILCMVITLLPSNVINAMASDSDDIDTSDNVIYGEADDDVEIESPDSSELPSYNNSNFSCADLRIGDHLCSGYRISNELPDGQYYTNLMFYFCVSRVNAGNKKYVFYYKNSTEFDRITTLKIPAYESCNIKEWIIGGFGDQQNEVYLYPAVHDDHGFVYSVENENVIRATCISEFCFNWGSTLRVPVNEKETKTFTLMAEDVGYSAYNNYEGAKLDGIDSFMRTTNLASVPEIVYFRTYEEGQVTGGQPVQASEIRKVPGYYYASVTVEGATAVKAFKVSAVEGVNTYTSGQVISCLDLKEGDRLFTGARVGNEAPNNGYYDSLRYYFCSTKENADSRKYAFSYSNGGYFDRRTSFAIPSYKNLNVDEWVVGGFDENRNGIYFYPAAHEEHTFEYVVESQDTIRATCNNPYCISWSNEERTPVVQPATEKVSLNANNADYSAYNIYTGASLSSIEIFKRVTGLVNTPEIMYYQVETAGATEGGVLVQSTDVRKTPGHYYAAVTVEGATVVKPFTVNATEGAKNYANDTVVSCLDLQIGDHVSGGARIGNEAPNNMFYDTLQFAFCNTKQKAENKEYVSIHKSNGVFDKKTTLLVPKYDIFANNEWVVGGFGNTKNEIYFYPAAHECHDFEYAVENKNIIRATCKSDYCFKWGSNVRTLIIEPATEIFVLNAEDVDYSDYNRYPGAKLEGIKAFMKVTDLEAEPEVTYYSVNNEGETSGGEKVDIADIRRIPGYYYASVTVGEATAVNSFTVKSSDGSKTYKSGNVVSCLDLKIGDHIFAGAKVGNETPDGDFFKKITFDFCSTKANAANNESEFFYYSDELKNKTTFTLPKFEDLSVTEWIVGGFGDANDEIYLYPAAHADHKFEYVLEDGNVIKAECKQNQCFCWDSEKRKCVEEGIIVGLTLSAPTEELSSSLKDATIKFGTDEELDAWIAAGIQVPGSTINDTFYVLKTYYEVDENGNKTGEGLENLPSKVGDYIVEVRVSLDNTEDIIVELKYNIQCTLHQLGTHHDATKADCNKEGNIDYYECSKCGVSVDRYKRAIQNVIIPIDTNGHSYANEWSSDADSHWHKTTCGHNDVLGSVSAHTYDAKNVCTVCKYAKPAEPVVEEKIVLGTDYDTLKTIEIPGKKGKTVISVDGNNGILTVNAGLKLQLSGSWKVAGLTNERVTPANADTIKWASTAGTKEDIKVLKKYAVAKYSAKTLATTVTAKSNKNVAGSVYAVKLVDDKGNTIILDIERIVIAKSAKNFMNLSPDVSEMSASDIIARADGNNVRTVSLSMVGNDAAKSRFNNNAITWIIGKGMLAEKIEFDKVSTVRNKNGDIVAQVTVTKDGSVKIVSGIVKGTVQLKAVINKKNYSASIKVK